MQVLECTHRFILTNDEQVCELCGCITPAEEELPINTDIPNRQFDFNRNTKRIHQYNFQQRVVDQQFSAPSIRRVQHLTTLFMRELGITRSVLEHDIIMMYTSPRSTGLSIGYNIAITVAGCMYICARRLQIPITPPQLVEVMLKNNLLPNIPRINNPRTDRKRLIKSLLNSAIRKRVLANNLFIARQDPVHEIITRISQVGAQKSYDILMIRRAIDMTNALLAQDPNVFAGHKPSLYAACIISIVSKRAKSTRTLARDFLITAPSMIYTLKRLNGLLDRYGIKRP